MKIEKVFARQILDSRGNPTVECDVYLEDNSFGRASVPSGASTGSNEALELRDGAKEYLGKGVLKAVSNVNEIIFPALKGKDAYDQANIDKIMIDLDGTENKEKLGANAILAVSLAVLKAAANSKNMPLYAYLGSGSTLPSPMMNILNGGAHADNNLEIQEFMIVPKASSMSDRIRMGSEIFHTLKNVLKERSLSTGVGDEGGFAPNLESNEEALDLICFSIEKAGYKLLEDVAIALDVAASEIYKDGFYTIDGKKLDFDGLCNYYEKLIEKYPIISIEDPVEENDFEGFAKMTEIFGDKVQLVGDDLFVTNEKFLKKAALMNAGNAILLKANQIGTVTEMINTINCAKEKGYNTVISHRSGETDDTFIAHFAVAFDLGQIKTGSMSRMDRICKYNELLRIEEDLKR